MNTFRKWNGKRIEDWGTVMSDDAKKFYRAFKNYLQREFPDAELIGFKPNHYDFSGFIKQGDNYIYISHSIDRYKERVDFNDSGVSTGVLYRTADGPKDYKGGRNNFCSIFKLGNCVRNLFNKMEMEKAAEVPVTESKTLNEKLYSYDEIQDMVTACRKDPELKAKVLSRFTSKSPLGKQDKAAVEAVINSGFADDFNRYDSAVCEYFITAYEIATSKTQQESINLAVDKILEGASLSSTIKFVLGESATDETAFAGTSNSKVSMPQAIKIAESFMETMNPDLWDGKTDVPDSVNTGIYECDTEFIINEEPFHIELTINTDVESTGDGKPCVYADLVSADGDSVDMEQTSDIGSVKAVAKMIYDLVNTQP